MKLVLHYGRKGLDGDIVETVGPTLEGVTRVCLIHGWRLRLSFDSQESFDRVFTTLGDLPSIYNLDPEGFVLDLLLESGCACASVGGVYHWFSDLEVLP